MKKISLIILFTLISFSLFAETIILKSGRKIEGKIIERGDEYIQVDCYGVPITYYSEEIKSINGESILPQTINKNTTQNFSPKSAKDIFRSCAPAVVRIQTDKGAGSGFIIDKSGIIVTNYHVVDQADTINVTLKDETRYTPTKILNYDILKDLCILKIGAENEVPFIPLGDSQRIETGESAFAIGNPAGYKYTISDGIISQHREEVFRSLFQFTCPVSPGSSGGPLLDPTGKAIGVVTSLIFSYDNVPIQNINFAIDIREVKILLAQERAMELSAFIKKMDDLDDFRQARLASDRNDKSKAVRLLNDFLRKRNYSLDDRDCFQAAMEALCIAVDMINEAINSGNTEKNIKFALEFAKNHITLVESLGGLEKIAHKYEFYSSPSAENLDKVKEPIIAGGYYFGGMIYGMLGDLRNAQDCLVKLKAFVPNSRAVADVEKAIKENSQ